jgi:hypothetical protein
MTSPRYSSLELEFKTALPSWTRFELTLVQSVADFIRTPDFTLEELMSLDPGIQLDSRVTPRQLIIQRVRNVLNYYISTHREPLEFDRLGQAEFGTLESVALAASLCEEFLDTNTPLSQLTTLRRCIHSDRGYWAK